jgi:hypothetical protein
MNNFGKFLHTFRRKCVKYKAQRKSANPTPDNKAIIIDDETNDESEQNELFSSSLFFISFVIVIVKQTKKFVISFVRI